MVLIKAAYPLKVTKHNLCELEFGTEPLEVSEEIADELLKNEALFEAVDNYKPKKNSQYKKALMELDGIGSATADQIIAKYSTQDALIQAVNEGAELGFREEINNVLTEKYKIGATSFTEQ